MENTNINRDGNLDSRIIEIANAVDSNDYETANILTAEITAKKAYYDSITVEQIKNEIESLQDQYFSKDVTSEEKAMLKEAIINKRNELVEKRDFDKKEDIILAICENDYNRSLEERNRIYRRRTLKKVLAVGAGIVIIALAARGCGKKEENNSRSIIAPLSTTIATLVNPNGDSDTATSTMSDNSESTGFYSINPEIAETIYENPYNNYYTGNSYTTSSASTNGTSSSNASQTSNTTSSSSTSTNPGSDAPYMEPGETTVWVQMPDTTPHGSDPLPIEPTTIVRDDTGINDRPAVSYETEGTSSTTLPPITNVSGTDETTYPTGSNQTVPTRPSTTEPTFPTVPTGTTPSLPSLDNVEGADEVTYDIPASTTRVTVATEPTYSIPTDRTEPIYSIPTDRTQPVVPSSLPQNIVGDDEVTYEIPRMTRSLRLK